MRRLLFLLILISIITPATASAFVPLPGFGGYVVFAIPCTCPPLGWRIEYVPILPVIYPWVFNALTVSVGITIPFDFQEFIINPVPTTWHKGTFVPSTGACFIGAPPACVLLPSDGEVINIGSSFPGFPPPAATSVL